MLNVSDATKQAYGTNSATRTNKQLNISFPDINLTLTNDDIKSESLTITERLETLDYLSFQGCNATMLKCEVVDLAQNVSGQHVIVTVTLNNETIPLFDGYVSDVTNLNHEDLTCQITAYDKLYEICNANVTSWYNGLSFPITLKNMRDSFFEHFNLTQVETTLINDSQKVTKAITDSVINGSTIIKGICQLNACYGKINREGEFEYITLTPITEGLYPADDLYPDDDLYPSDENSAEMISRNDYINVEYEPYKTEIITKVNIYGKSGTITGTYGNSDDNIFNIHDNKIAIGLQNPNVVAQTIYEEIYQIEFTPANSIKVLAKPYLETGDAVSLNTNKRIVRTYILSRTMQGIQAMTDLYESKSQQYQPIYHQSLETTVQTNTTKIATTNSNLATTNSNLSSTTSRVSSLEADHVSISSLNAVSARVGSLEADHVTVAQLNATNARIGTVEANYITADNINAKSFVLDSGHIGNLSASKITSGTISANRIDSAGVVQAGLTSSTNISCNSCGIYGNLVFGGSTISKKSATIAGQTIYYLGY